MTDERELHSNRTLEGRTELDLVQDEIDETKEIAGGSHLEVQAAQSKVTEAAFRVGQVMEGMSQIWKLLEANSEPADQWRQARRNVCWAASKKTKTMWERWYEAIMEEEKLQSNRDITVHRFL